jgi:hypothetical protein
MRRLVMIVIMLVGTSAGQTKLFLKATTSMLNSAPSGWNQKRLETSQGTTKVALTMSSVAGPITGQYFPDGAVFAPGSVKQYWFSPALSANVTISGPITPNLWGMESSSTCHAGFRYEVFKWTRMAGGMVLSLGKSTDNGATEWGTSAAARTGPVLNPSATNFVSGDRVIVVLFNDDANGQTQASGCNWTLDYGGPAGVDGDSYFQFSENMSFAADSNNGRAVGIGQ